MVPLEEAREMSPEQLKEVVRAQHRRILRFEKRATEQNRRPNMEEHQRLLNHLTGLSRILCEKMDDEEYTEWKNKQLEEVTID